MGKKSHLQPIHESSRCVLHRGKCLILMLKRKLETFLAYRLPAPTPCTKTKVNPADSSLHGRAVSRGCWRCTCLVQGKSILTSYMSLLRSSPWQSWFTCNKPKIKFAWHWSTNSTELLKDPDFILPQDNQQAPDPWKARFLLAPAGSSRARREGWSVHIRFAWDFSSVWFSQWPPWTGCSEPPIPFMMPLTALGLFPSENFLGHHLWKGVLSCWVKH